MSDTEAEAGIYDLSTLPSKVSNQLAESKMRFAIWHTIPDNTRLAICVLPSTVITIPPRHHIFINNITDDLRAKWLLRGIDSSSVGEVTRKTEVTRFRFDTRDEDDLPRIVYLFVRVYPPHFVELGTDRRNGGLSVRIEQMCDGFGDVAELSLAVGEEEQ